MQGSLTNERGMSFIYFQYNYSMIILVMIQNDYEI